MFNQSVKVLALLFCLSIVFSSCNKDEAFSITEDTQNFQNNNNDNSGRSAPQGEEIRQLNSNVLLQWMDLFLEVERYSAGMRPNASARAMAYISLAAYETAAPGMPNFRSNSERIPEFVLSTEVLPVEIDWQIALNTCYADVIQHFLYNFPEAYNSKISDLESNIENSLSNNLNTDVISASKDWGASVASQVIAYSQTDVEAENQILAPQPLSYEPPTGPGFWTYSADEERALFPYWGKVRTFIVDVAETSTVAPIAYSENSNSDYFRQMAEVVASNNAAREEDGEDLWIAEFWSDDVEGLMFSPPARQFSIANQLVEQYGLDLDNALHLYLKLGFSLNDAAVSTWKYKYEHMVMRPNVYIHEFIDPDFQTNLYRLVYWPNPSFPSYPSGHSCFASAAAGVFIDFFGNRTNFTDRSHEGRTEFRGAPRRFNSFRQLAEENAYSRIPLGVHMRMDCTEGLRLGYEISDGINRYQVRERDGRNNRGNGPG